MRLVPPILRRGFSTSAGQLRGPLAGLRVLELGSFIAGPHCGTVLASFGAEVIKVEPRGGDQIRSWREVDDSGTAYWWRSLGRNKKSLSVDLRAEGGRDLIRKLVPHCDALVENFKPGRMEGWGLGPDDLLALQPRLVYTRVSGYGQTGPYSQRPGFASACEAMGGLRYVNGFPDRPSVRLNLSLGDTLAGERAAMGTVLALLARERGVVDSGGGGGGQVVDCSIVESVFAVMEGVLPEYSGNGAVRGPSGSSVTGIVPTGTYPCGDGKDVVIGANSDTLFQRLAKLMGRGDMDTSDDEAGGTEAARRKFGSNALRVENQAEIDASIAEWTREQPSAEAACEALNGAEIPNGRIYSIEDIVADPHVQARGMIETVTIGGGGGTEASSASPRQRELDIPSVTPLLSRTPGGTAWPGRDFAGQDTEEVLQSVLGLSEEAVRELADEGVVFTTS